MSDPVLPYKDSPLDKKRQVAGMFNNISRRYDFLNHFLSLGIDRYWRRTAINTLRLPDSALILDVATGTADLALETIRLNPLKIFGIDISTDMLAIGKEKIKRRKLTGKIELLEGDSEHLIFEDNKFDAITVAFGVRNFANLAKGLTEMCRVLKPGGQLVVLEFSQPGSPLIRRLYDFYSGKITPWIGKKISKDAAAYGYLHESVTAFPSGKAFTDILEKCGYVRTKARPLTFGVVTIYTASKN